MSVKEFFRDWNSATRELSEAEKNRLARAIIAKSNGDEVNVVGNEKYVFSLYADRLDSEKEEVERAV